MNRLVMLGCVCIAAGCSAFNVTPPSAEPAPVSRTVAVPVDRTWRGLVAAMESMGFTLAVSDRTSGLLTSTEKQVNEGLTIAGQNQVFYADCGHVLGRPAASGTDVFVTVQAQVTAAGSDSSAVRLMVQMRGHNAEVARMQGGDAVQRAASGNADMKCISKGTLEEALFQRLSRP